MTSANLMNVVGCVVNVKFVTLGIGTPDRARNAVTVRAWSVFKLITLN